MFTDTPILDIDFYSQNRDKSRSGVERLRENTTPLACFALPVVQPFFVCIKRSFIVSIYQTKPYHTATSHMDSNLTANSALESTLHDRERREERNIDKVTLQEARRYGMKETQGKRGIVKYYYAGHVFVYNEQTNKAITSYKYERDRDLYSFAAIRSDEKQEKPVEGADNGEESVAPCSPQKQQKESKPIKSGTRFTRPVRIEKSKDHENLGIAGSHEVVTTHVQNHPALWTSHTVIIVDMSGSMREDDVNGARCRSDGVWTTLARNFCRAQLEDQSSSLYDVVSIIVMGQTANVVVRCEPLTWVLYNKLVDFREVSVINMNIVFVHSKWPSFS